LTVINASLILKNSTFYDNKATSIGGAILFS